MDFLNKSLAQLSDLFRSMTPGARITAGLLLAVVVISFGYLFQHGTTGPDAFLFGGEALSDNQLMQVEAAIAQAGLSGVQREGNRIRVPAGQQAAYLAAVADAGALPPNFNMILENALDSGGPWESREATVQRMKIAKQRTLGEIVQSMYWVDEAVVLYDTQQSRRPNSLAGNQQVTASVNVQPIAGETLDLRREKRLKTLVSYAIGIQPENVAVINLGDGSGDGPDGQMFPEMFDDDYFKTKIAFEMQKQVSIKNALHMIPGVRVEVNAELDNTIQEETRGVKPDKNAVDRREVTSSDSTIQTTAANGGRPRLVSQGPSHRIGGEPPTPPRNKNETKSETSETGKVAGMEEIRTVRHGLMPKEVWATVTIPSKYVEDIWKSRNPTATDPPKTEDMRVVHDEVVAKVENIVEPLLLQGATKAQDTYKYVRVEVLDSLPSPAMAPPSIATTAVAWTGQYWSTLAMLGVAVFSLLVLRSVVKGSPSDATTVAAGAPALSRHADVSAAAQGEDDDDGDSDRPRLHLKKGKSLKDNLVEIVREDPGAAADILRSWIGKAR